ncbi:hypothetical protein B0H19DRAFT_1277382 [Mycena capillaripes]|nr:hypothetical protein B0H19DRAFT_1277382 [Mycena capillaripes]
MAPTPHPTLRTPPLHRPPLLRSGIRQRALPWRQHPKHPGAPQVPIGSGRAGHVEQELNREGDESGNTAYGRGQAGETGGPGASLRCQARAPVRWGPLLPSRLCRRLVHPYRRLPTPAPKVKPGVVSDAHAGGTDAGAGAESSLGSTQATSTGGDANGDGAKSSARARAPALTCWGLGLYTGGGAGGSRRARARIRGAVLLVLKLVFVAMVIAIDVEVRILAEEEEAERAACGAAVNHLKDECTEYVLIDEMEPHVATDRVHRLHNLPGDIFVFIPPYVFDPPLQLV